MSKILVIFGNITFHHLVDEELRLFKTNNEQKALVHSIDKVFECEANEEAIDKLIYDEETEAWLIPSEFKGEIVYEPNPEEDILNIAKSFLEKSI
jgi:hypothetical protein